MVMQNMCIISVTIRRSQAGLDWDKKSALAFFGAGGPPPLYNIYIYIYIYMIYTTIQKFLNSKIF